MFLVSSIIRSHANFILILMTFNPVSSIPLKSQQHLSNGNEQGFSVSPRIVEIQLPLKIASREDLLAWSDYVTNLMASKMNFATANVKDTSLIGTQHDHQRMSFIDNSNSRFQEMTQQSSSDFNYPLQTFEEKRRQGPNDMVVAYPLPLGAMSFMKSKPHDPFTLSTTKIHAPINHQTYFDQNTDFNMRNPIQQSNNPINMMQSPSAMYLPSPVKTTDTPEYQNEDAVKLSPNAIDSNISDFKESAKFANMKDSLIRRIEAFNNKELSPIAINNGLTEKNLSHDSGEPLLTFPFQAVITITRPDASTAMTTISKLAKQPKTFLTAPTNPDKFSRSKKNHTSESEQFNIDNIAIDKTRKTIKQNEEVRERKEKSDSREQKVKQRQNSKQQISIKRQSNLLGDLLRMLGVLKKLPKNSTEISVAAPVLSILKGTNSQKVQVAFEEETIGNRERRNETSPQAEELNDEEEQEEMGGSIQNLLELLPLAAPVLEEISDPNSDVNIPELIQGAIPLIQGFSDPTEEGGVDIPAVLVPILQKVFAGPDGNGSDAGALIGPGIQLVAPLIGPILGPLIGPLSRTFSGPDGAAGFASVISAALTPFSKPGYDGHSILSKLIASTTAGLSKEFAGLATQSDIKPIVSSVVSGLLAGTSAGSSTLSKDKKNPYYPGHKGTYSGQKDTYSGQKNTYSSYNDASYAPSSYYGYGPSHYEDHFFTAAVKQILGAFLKLSATSSSAGASLSGASSNGGASLSASSSESSKPPHHYGQYGPPPIYGLHPSYNTQSVKPVYPPNSKYQG